MSLSSDTASIKQLNDSANYDSSNASGPQIENALKRYELALSSLVDSLAKFTPDEKWAHELLASDRYLNESIVQLKEHYKAGLTIDQLRETSYVLDKKLGLMLLGLTDGRQQLKQIEADVETGAGDQGNERPISAEKLINYATKITKFTHAPPGYNPGLPNEHANYPWPSEDELRRGVLALDAMNQTADKERYEGSGEVQEKMVSEAPVQVAHTTQRNRASSLVSYDDRPMVGPSSGAAGPQVLELDLFDPDAEDDDEYN